MKPLYLIVAEKQDFLTEGNLFLLKPQLEGLGYEVIRAYPDEYKENGTRPMYAYFQSFEGKSADICRKLAANNMQTIFFVWRETIDDFLDITKQCRFIYARDASTHAIFEYARNELIGNPIKEMHMSML